MTHPYGFIRNTGGVDGDEVDVFLGPNESADKAYVVHTRNPQTMDYDEDKVMLGFDSCGEAVGAFLDNYSNKHFFQSVETVFFEDLKKKIKDISRTQDQSL
jgi:hypothetical protein